MDTADLTLEAPRLDIPGHRKLSGPSRGSRGSKGPRRRPGGRRSTRRRYVLELYAGSARLTGACKETGMRIACPVDALFKVEYNSSPAELYKSAFHENKLESCNIHDQKS